MRDKRKWLDYIITVPATVLCAPVLVGIAIWVRLDSPGPVFFRQKRVGIHQNYFEILKFRTMRTDTPENVPTHLLEHPEQYITKSGKFLRATSLDELPQLFCTLIGTMTLVGPRPERECFSIEFEKHVPGFSERLKVKPGITGYAQVHGGYDLPPQEKVKWDIEYIKHRSLWQDIRILFRTVGVIFSHDGAK